MATLLYNRDYGEGQAASLRVAVDHAISQCHESIVVGLADQPFIEVSAWVAVRDTSGVLVTATYSGQRLPPVKIHESLFAELPQSGDVGAKALMIGRPELVTEVTCGSNPADIDTNEDLERWN